MERGPDPHLNPPTSSPSELNTRGLLRRSFDEFLMKEDSVVEKCGYQGSQKMQSFSSSRNLYLLISALLGYKWYIKNCTYLMHAFWWIWTHTYTCETISATWVISTSVTSKCFLVTSFFFFFFSWWCWWNSASVRWCWTEMQRQFWVKWKRMALWLFQAKGQANALKTVSPLEGAVRSLIKFEEQGLIGWWWGNQESASSTFCWGLHASGQHAGNFSHLVGVSVSAKQLKGHGSEYYL